jgi:outer membrane protein TolC
VTPVTWEQAVREASENNPSLREARAALRRAEAELRGAWSPFLPDVTLKAGVAKTKNVGKTYSESASAGWNLFNGFSDRAALKRSRADLDAARAAWDDALAQVGGSLRSDFAQLLFAQEQAALAAAIAKRRHEDLRMVSLRFQAGQENKGSYLRTDAADKQALFDEAQAARALRVAQRGLAHSLGRDPFAVLVATGVLGGELPSETPDFLALAAQTPAVRQADADARAAGYALTAARSGFFPSVDASAQKSRTGSEWPPGKDSWSTGLNASWSIFSGGKTAADASAARAQAEAAQAALEETKNLTAFRLEDSYASFQNAVEQVDVLRRFLAAAEARAEIARAQYNNGLISFQDWDQIENDLINSQKSLLAGRRNAATAMAAWEKTRGKGVLP